MLDTPGIDYGYILEKARSLKEVAMRLQGSWKAPRGKKTRRDHAKSRSGKSKTKAEGRPNWRHRAAAVLEAERQEELRAEWAEMEERRVLEMLDFGFRMYRAGARGVGERLSNTYRTPIEHLSNT